MTASDFVKQMTKEMNSNYKTKENDMKKTELTKEDKEHQEDCVRKLEEDCRFYSKFYCLTHVITPKQFKEHYGYE